MSNETRITNGQIYAIYERVMDQPVHHLERQAVRQFARAIIDADRAAREQSMCECEIGAKKCERCGLVGGCSVGCEK